MSSTLCPCPSLWIPSLLARTSGAVGGFLSLFTASDLSLSRLLVDSEVGSNSTPYDGGRTTHGRSPVDPIGLVQ